MLKFAACTITMLLGFAGMIFFVILGGGESGEEVNGYTMLGGLLGLLALVVPFIIDNWNVPGDVKRARERLHANQVVNDGMFNWESDFISECHSYGLSDAEVTDCLDQAELGSSKYQNANFSGGC